MTDARRTRFFGAILFALVVLTLANPADWAADEHLYLAGGQVMKEGGSLLVPAYHTGEPRYMKPPLYYWAVWASMLLFGTGFFAARLPALLSGMVVFYFTWRLASEGGWRPRDGAMAAAALGGSYLFLYHARAAVTDMTMTAGITAGLCFLTEHLRTRRGVVSLYLAAGSLGVACMAKGPVALMIAFSAAAFFALMPGRPALPGMRLSLHWLLALAVLLAVGFWWYAAMWATQGPAFLQHQVDAEVAARTRASLVHRLGNLAWYSGKAFTTALPWTLAAGWGLLSGSRPGASPARRMAWCACTATVLFYGLAINWRASRYLLPMAPFLAVIIGQGLSADGDSRSRGGASARVLVHSTAALTGLAAVLLAIFLAAARNDLSQFQTAAFGAAALASAALCAALELGDARSDAAVLAASAALVFLFTVPNLLVKGVVRKDPILEIARSTRRFPPGVAVSDAGLSNRESALLFVFGRRDAVRFGWPARESDLVIVRGSQDVPSGRFEAAEAFEGPVLRGAPTGIEKDLFGILRRGDLLRRLPRTRYFLARPAPSVHPSGGGAALPSAPPRDETADREVHP